MKHPKLLAMTAGLVLLGTGVNASGQTVGDPGIGGVSAATSVAAYYAARSGTNIWFRSGAADPAAGQLVAMLKRAPFDGMASGPQLAAQVEAALAQAQSGRAEDVAAAERVLSTAWVAYAQQVKRPTTGMIYAYPVLQPQGARADQILLTAAAAPSLGAYMATVANVNPIYAQLRDAAWSEAQASGNMTPDPRLLANLDRVRSLPASGRFLVVDAGASTLTLYQNGQVLDSMKVITGTKELPTPLIAPRWHNSWLMVSISRRPALAF